MDRVTYEVSKFQVIDYEGRGCCKPLVMESTVLAGICDLKGKQFRSRLGIDSSNLSDLQLDAIGSMVLCHEERFEIFAESFNNTLLEPIAVNAADVDSWLKEIENATFRKRTCLAPEAGQVLRVRQGFFLADGHGMGKTRTLAGLISEYTTRKLYRTLFVCGSSRECDRITTFSYVNGITNSLFKFVVASRNDPTKLQSAFSRLKPSQAFKLTDEVT